MTMLRALAFSTVFTFVPMYDALGQGSFPAGVTMRLGTTKLRHGGVAACSPDGTMLARGASGIRLGSDKLRHAGAQGVTFSPDGSTIATGGGDIRLWDAKTLNLQRVLPLPNRIRDGDVYRMRFTSDGKTLHFHRANVERLWAIDVASGQLVANVDPKMNIAATDVSPDGKWRVVDGGQFGELRVLDRASGKVRFRVPGVPGSYGCLAFSPDGNRLASFHWSGAHLWDLNTGKCLLEDEGHMGVIGAIDISPDGATVATGASDSNVFLWDAKTGKVRHRLPVAGGAGITSVAFAPDGRSVLAGCYLTQFVHVWDVATGKEIRRVPINDYVARIQFSPDGKMLAVATWRDLTVIFFDAVTFKERSRHSWATGVGTGHNPFQFSPDGKHLAALYAPVAGADAIALANLPNTKPQIVSGEMRHVTDIAFSPDAEFLAWCEFTARGLDDFTWHAHLFDMRQNRTVKKFKVNECSCVAFTPDGRYLIAGKQMLPLDPKRPALELPISPRCLVFSRDGRLLVAAPLESATARLWSKTP